jgi:hypothetical protein
VGNGRDSSQRRQSNRARPFLIYYYSLGQGGTDHFLPPLPSSPSRLLSFLSPSVQGETQQVHVSSQLEQQALLGLCCVLLPAFLASHPSRLSTTPVGGPRRRKKMTEVAPSSSQPRHHPAPTGPLTRSAMAARPAGAAGPPAAAGQHGSETSPAATPLSSSGPPAPPPQESSHEPHRRSITRKRAASINTEEANRPKIESLSLATPSTASPRPFDTSGGLVCLCTPAPKVPRPRNGMSFPIIGSRKPSCTHLPTPCDLSVLSHLSLMQRGAGERNLHQKHR